MPSHAAAVEINEIDFKPLLSALKAFLKSDDNYVHAHGGLAVGQGDQDQSALDRVKAIV